MFVWVLKIFLHFLTGHVAFYPPPQKQSQQAGFILLYRSDPDLLPFPHQEEANSLISLHPPWWWGRPKSLNVKICDQFLMFFEFLNIFQGTYKDHTPKWLSSSLSQTTSAGQIPSFVLWTSAPEMGPHCPKPTLVLSRALITALSSTEQTPAAVASLWAPSKPLLQLLGESQLVLLSKTPGVITELLIIEFLCTHL